ncbi:hypothetical protein ACFQ46_11425 [Kineococcus sp. GCM10028916]|uniref:hypothetical protein n=1 Tax=Kineococcus sp. GCM10028916 TaxID=3273394 RepID=UPI003641AA24
MSPSPLEGRFPLTGQPVPVRVDGRTRYAWWGQDRDGNDCLATRGGRLEVADSEAGIRDAATSYGWEATSEEAPGEGVADEAEDAVVIDVDEVRAWLSHAGRAVPVVAALNVWNLAIDVAYSLGRVRGDRGFWADRAYDKLFAANVPWALGLAAYRPRWTSQELTALRRIEGEAVGLLRTTLTGV